MSVPENPHTVRNNEIIGASSHIMTNGSCPSSRTGNRNLDQNSPCRTYPFYIAIQ
ncbi:hypothetical protein RP20_CCG010342 [Aedes albopictus]|nr:hypothetical protein RP20_CCG010342 [Aedes albopictus]